MDQDAILMGVSPIEKVRAKANKRTKIKEYGPNSVPIPLTASMGASPSMKIVNKINPPTKRKPTFKELGNAMRGSSYSNIESQIGKYPSNNNTPPKAPMGLTPINISTHHEFGDTLSVPPAGSTPPPFPSQPHSPCWPELSINIPTQQSHHSSNGPVEVISESNREEEEDIDVDIEMDISSDTLKDKEKISNRARERWQKAIRKVIIINRWTNTILKDQQRYGTIYIYIYITQTPHIYIGRDTYYMSLDCVTEKIVLPKCVQFI